MNMNPNLRRQTQGPFIGHQNGMVVIDLGPAGPKALPVPSALTLIGMIQQATIAAVMEDVMRAAAEKCCIECKVKLVRAREEMVKAMTSSSAPTPAESEGEELAKEEDPAQAPTQPKIILTGG